MAVVFDPDVISAFMSGNIGQRHYLLSFAFDSGTRYFTTIPNGKTWKGNDYVYQGAVGSVGTVMESDKLDPAEYDIVIGSADTVLLATFLSEPTLNRGVECWQCLTDDAQNIIESVQDAGPWQYFKGKMQPASINDGEEPTINIQVKDELADWDRNITSLYTDAEQQRLHPGDKCFQFVSQIAAKNINWPSAALQRAQG